MKMREAMKITIKVLILLTAILLAFSGFTVNADMETQSIIDDIVTSPDILPRPIGIPDP